MKLNLGVIDEAYSAGNGVQTTGKVARILEDNYHVMEKFYELHGEAVSKAVSDAVGGAIESMLRGGEQVVGPALDVSRIKAQFMSYLDSGEWEKASGQRIKAAHNRHTVHHNDGSTEQSRRSDKAFVRTGQYENAFIAWIEGDKK